MTIRKSVWANFTRWGGRLAVFLAFSVGVIGLLLWLAGGFEPKVPATVATAETAASSGELATAPVRRVRLPLVESAVGTIRAVHETSVGSKLLARVVEVNLKAGQKVRTGDVLVRLDDADLRAKLEQAKAAVASAQAAHENAATDEKRYASLVKTNSISQQEYDKAVTALRSAEANLRQAEEAVKELQVMLDWATIRAPLDGTVIDKKIDAGDMVTPGQVLLTLYDPTKMQMVASVRESLAHQLQVGQSLPVRVEGLNKECSGNISEVVPEAQSASRSFQVKVTGPCPTGIYSGMFGRILIPLGEEEVLVIPKQARQNVGQLELVEVVEQGKVVRRAIRTGRELGDNLEVLSGLSEGERVVIPAGAGKEASHG